MVQRVVGREEVEKVVFGEGHVADNPGFLTAAQEIAKLPTNDWFMEGYEGADFTTAQAIYFQGKAAMIHMGSWLAAEMKDAIPPDFRLGVFDFPTFDGGAGDQAAMFGTAQMWSVANPAKAIESRGECAARRRVPEAVDLGREPNVGVRKSPDDSGRERCAGADRDDRDGSDGAEVGHL